MALVKPLHRYSTKKFRQYLTAVVVTVLMASTTAITESVAAMTALIVWINVAIRYFICFDDGDRV